jgi:hypothetical protein
MKDHDRGQNNQVGDNSYHRDLGPCSIGPASVTAADDADDADANAAAFDSRGNHNQRLTATDVRFR